MQTEHEIARLQQVYRGYGESAAVRARWDTQNPGNQAIDRERWRQIRAALRAGERFPLSGLRILEVGCGNGGILRGLPALGAHAADTFGLDLLRERVERAQQHNPGATVMMANAEALPFRSERFDLILVFTVFSSILDRAMAQHVAGEIDRLLYPRGAVLWYDFRFNNPRNPHVRGMPRAAIRALFPGFDLRLRSTTVLPPLARRLGRATPLLYPALAAIPPLRTHYLGLLVKQ